MKLLILGGIGEAVELCQYLHDAGHSVIYSVVQSGGENLPCKVIRGGYDSAQSLIKILDQYNIELLMDVTHPYAVKIKRQAHQAAQKINIIYWQFNRSAWQPNKGDRWQIKNDLTHIVVDTEPYRRPFFALGRQPLQFLAHIKTHQQWIIRCLQKVDRGDQYIVLNDKGPFSLKSELTLMQQHEIDVLVCKNSGGLAVAEKLRAARQLHIPVMMLKRPPLEDVLHKFSSIQAMQNTQLLNTKKIKAYNEK